MAEKSVGPEELWKKYTETLEPLMVVVSAHKAVVKAVETTSGRVRRPTLHAFSLIRQAMVEAMGDESRAHKAWAAIAGAPDLFDDHDDAAARESIAGRDNVRPIRGNKGKAVKPGKAKPPKQLESPPTEASPE